MYDILIDVPNNSGRIASAIDTEFRNSTAETKTETEQAFTVGFLSLLGNVKMFLIAIAGAVTFTILIDDPQNSSRIASAIDTEFRNSTAETKTETEQAFTVGFLSLLGNVKMFLIAISGAVTFTILLVSANTMAMSVRERVREVGVLKTLGFASSEILGLILGEALSISIAGGLIGYLISAGLMTIVAKSPIGGFLPTLPFI